MDTTNPNRIDPGTPPPAPTPSDPAANDPTAGDPTHRYDVVVVGGGAAGLGGALTLARARRSVLVIDAGEPRNAPAGHVHNYLGREGTPPGELLAIGRQEVAGYGGEVVPGRVTAVRRLDDGAFRVERDDAPPVAARRLLVTTGLVDELPDVAGLADRWGREVLHCPYCHGWEVRDEPIAILATSPLLMHHALLWRQWTADLTVVLHATAAPTGDDAEQLAALGIRVVAGPAVGLEVVDDRLAGLRLADGGVVACGHVVVQPRFTARADLLVQLGLPLADQVMAGQVIGTYVAADPTGATTVAGVWVAGNVANLSEQVIGSAAAGLKAAAAINMDLATEDAQAAVAARRTTEAAPV